MGRERIILFLYLDPWLNLYEFDAVIEALRKKYGSNVA